MRTASSAIRLVISLELALATQKEFIHMAVDALNVVTKLTWLNSVLVLNEHKMITKHQKR
jgi:hypothetical protein